MYKTGVDSVNKCSVTCSSQRSIMAAFGALVKQLRIQDRLTLREFCRRLDLDPSNWSKIERGISPPPGSVDSMASFFSLQGERLQEFTDAAAVARNRLPADIISNDQMVANLPAFFAVIRTGAPQSRLATQELIRDIQLANSHH